MARPRPRSVLPFVLLALGAAMGCGGARSSTNAPAAALPPLSPTPEDAETAALALADHVDPARGLVVVARLEDASDGEAPPMIVTGLRCSDADVRAVATQLAEYVAQRRSYGETVEWSCHDTRCELRGMMEYDPTRVLRFARADDGRAIVVGVDYFEDVGSGPEYVQEVRVAVEQDHAAMPDRCP